MLRIDAHADDTHDSTARLGEIRCPTTVLVGSEDAPFRHPSDALARGIPGARQVVIANAAHCPQLENTEAWLAAVEGRARVALGRSTTRSGSFPRSQPRDHARHVAAVLAIALAETPLELRLLDQRDEDQVEREEGCGP